MNGWRSAPVGWAARSLMLLGVVLLIAGALLGWLAPHLPASLPLVAPAHMLVAGAGIDVSGYLGADITALAVIIAVIIGFNATTLQIAGQTHSLALVRVILVSLMPFLVCWSLTTGVALSYFLLPPVYVAQLWQMLLWFGAVVLLMVAYLWDLPWRLSGRFVGKWAIRNLRNQPLHRWETLDSFSALQTAVAAASARGDIGTVRAITSILGRFLAGIRDPDAEAAPDFDRARYRALKNLLSGCAQNTRQAPNAVAYHVGRVLAGVLLQASAIGLPMTDGDHDIFSGVLRELRGTPERLTPLWTGMRHALCRPGEHASPYLMKFWLEHRRWTADDPRRAARVAEGLAQFHASCWRELRATLEHPDADAEALQMVVDLYRDLSIHLGKLTTHEHRLVAGVSATDLTLSLLDSVHASVMYDWQAGEADAHRVTAVNAYEARRAELVALSGTVR